MTMHECKALGCLNMSGHPSKTCPRHRHQDTRIVPPSHSFEHADPKIGGEQKTENEGKISPMCGTKDDSDYIDRLREYNALRDRRDELLSMGVDSRKLMVPIKPRRTGETTRLPRSAYTNLAQCTTNFDFFENERAVLVGIGAAGYEITPAMQEAAKEADMPLSHMEARITIPEGPPKMVPMNEVTRQKIDAMSREEVEAIGKPVAEYLWDGAAGGKDSNPKEAFGTRKAGLSCISSQVMYEVGLAMLEGALKYGRHNYRIAGVRASTYYDACGRHMDAWWEGQDIDPDSGAELHHVTKAIAGLTVLRDSMLTGNWTDDRPPRIGDPNWLAWYNKQAAILVDACKNPKPPFTEKEHGK